jgi:hypothetical protein
LILRWTIGIFRFWIGLCVRGCGLFLLDELDGDVFVAAGAWDVVVVLEFAFLAGYDSSEVLEAGLLGLVAAWSWNFVVF